MYRKLMSALVFISNIAITIALSSAQQTQLSDENSADEITNSSKQVNITKSTEGILIIKIPKDINNIISKTLILLPSDFSNRQKTLIFKKERTDILFTVSIGNEFNSTHIDFTPKKRTFREQSHSIELKIKDRITNHGHNSIPIYFSQTYSGNSPKKILDIIIKPEERWKVLLSKVELNPGVKKRTNSVRVGNGHKIKIDIENLTNQSYETEINLKGNMQAKVSTDKLILDKKASFDIILNPKQIGDQNLEFSIINSNDSVSRDYFLIIPVEKSLSQDYDIKNCLVCFKNNKNIYKTKITSNNQKEIEIKNKSNKDRYILIKKDHKHNEFIKINNKPPILIKKNQTESVDLIISPQNDTPEREFKLELYASKDLTISDDDEKLNLTVVTQDQNHFLGALKSKTGMGLILLSIGFCLGWWLFHKKGKPKNKAIMEFIPLLEKSIDQLQTLPEQLARDMRLFLPKGSKHQASTVIRHINKLVTISLAGIGAANVPRRRLSEYENTKIESIVKKLNKISIPPNENLPDPSSFLTKLRNIFSRPSNQQPLGTSGFSLRETELNEDQIISHATALKAEDRHMEEFLNLSVKSFHSKEIAYAERAVKRRAIEYQFQEVHQLLCYLKEDIRSPDVTIKAVRELLKNQTSEIEQQNEKYRGLQQYIKQVQDDLQNIREDKSRLLQILELIDQSIHFKSNKDDWEQLRPSDLTSSLQFLKQKDPLLPNFVAQFRDMAKMMANELTQLKQKLAGHSDFANLIDVAIHGPNQNSGPAGIVQMIGKADHHQSLRAILGLESPERLRDLGKELFFRKLVKPLFIPSVNAFFQLYLYKEIHFNGISVLDDFRTDDLDLTILERVHSILRGSMQMLFNLEIIAANLFVDQFDPEKHERAHEPTLIKLPQLGKKYYAMLDKLKPNVIYDLSEVGLRSSFLRLHVKPRLIPHNP